MKILFTSSFFSPAKKSFKISKKQKKTNTSTHKHTQKKMYEEEDSKENISPRTEEDEIKRYLYTYAL